MTVKNGIKIILADNEKSKNNETIKYLNEILKNIPDDFKYRQELIRNTINTLEMIAKYEFIDY